MTNNDLLQRLHDLNASSDILSAVKQFFEDRANESRRHEREKKARQRARTTMSTGTPRMSPGHVPGTLKSLDIPVPGTPPGSPSLSPLTLSPITTPPSPSKTIVRQASQWKQDATFMAFYAAYPRKVAPMAAYKAYVRVIRDSMTTPEALRNAAERYAREKVGVDSQYVKHPSTWLNGGCWADGEQVDSQDRRKELFNGNDHEAELLAERDRIWQEIGMAGDSNGHAAVPSVAPVLRKPSGFRPLGAGGVFRAKAE